MRRDHRLGVRFALPPLTKLQFGSKMRIRIKACNNIICFLENRPLLAWALTIIYAAIIFYFSSQPKPLSGIFTSIPSLVKHIVEYAGFGVLLFISFLSIKQDKIKALFLTMIVSITYGFSDEIHQLFVPGRVYSLVDVTADAIGGFFGSLFGISQKN